MHGWRDYETARFNRVTSLPLEPRLPSLGGYSGLAPTLAARDRFAPSADVSRVRENLSHLRENRGVAVRETQQPRRPHAAEATPARRQGRAPKPALLRSRLRVGAINGRSSEPVQQPMDNAVALGLPVWMSPRVVRRLRLGLFGLSSRTLELRLVGWHE